MTDNRKIARLRGEIELLEEEKRRQEAMSQGGGLLVTISSGGAIIGLLLVIYQFWLLGGLVLLISAGIFGYQWYRRRQAIQRVAEINVQVAQFEQDIAAEMGLASADPS
jgi:hypothetical protein